MIYKFYNTSYPGDINKVKEEYLEFVREVEIKIDNEYAGIKVDNKQEIIDEALDLMKSVDTYLQEHYTQEEIYQAQNRLSTKLAKRGVINAKRFDYKNIIKHQK